MATILLIDDDDLLLRAAEDHLRHSGHQVIAVSDTISALDALDAGRDVDLAIVDIMMPKGLPHGASFARMVKLKRPELPIIFITGHEGVANGDVPLPGPVYQKPVDWVTLTAEIEATLRARPAPIGDNDRAASLGPAS
jgi:CheY-like chemotaxis protein